MASSFLTAQWRRLAIANYDIPPEKLHPLLPAQTQLDLWKGKCYLSLVGFMFLDTRVRGIKIPCHVNFEEVNLRFYVNHTTPTGEFRRGVVFVKEIVPRAAITFVANRVYGEHYDTMPMRHSWEESGDRLKVRYGMNRGGWSDFGVEADLATREMQAGEEADFITEHYWGYTRLSPSSTGQYGVEHPRWRVHQVHSYDIQVNFGAVYGPEWAFLHQMTPESVMLAEGSPIVVRKGEKIGS